MQKKQFRIGECAKHLNIERFVLRFWEKEFNLKTDRSSGGQRFYNNEDVALFTEIKDLLYQKGFTIAGAKKHIAQTRSRANKSYTNKSHTATTNNQAANNQVIDNQITNSQAETYSSAQKQTLEEMTEQAIELKHAKETELALLEANKKLTLEKEELKNQLLHLNKQLHKLQNLL